MVTRLPWLMLAALALTCLPACSGGYTLSGRVIEGDYSHVQFVEPNDPRLTEGPGIDGAQLLIFRDPSSLGRKLAAQSSSGIDGTFQCRIGDFGAGWLIEDWEITVTRPSFANASRTGQLPRDSKSMQMLVILARGASTPIPTGDPFQDDLDRFGR